MSYHLNDLNTIAHLWVIGLGVSGCLKLTYKWPNAVTLHTREQSLVLQSIWTTKADVWLQEDTFQPLLGSRPPKTLTGYKSKLF